MDAASGLVHTMVGTSANVSGINVAGALPHSEEHAAFGDSGYQGVHKRAEAAGPTWHVAMRPGKHRLLNPFIEPEFVAERVDKMKASLRAQIEHPFRVIKQQSGFTKLRYRGLAKNTAQIVTLFALPNLCMLQDDLQGLDPGSSLAARAIEFAMSIHAYALRLAESGTPVVDVCRQIGIPEATYYTWKKKLGALGMTEPSA